MDLAALKNIVKENMAGEKKSKADNASRMEVAEKLNGSVDFDLPPSTVDEETHNTVYDIVQENQNRGIPATVLEEKKDEIFNNAARIAKESVKFKFIASRIAEEEKIDVTETQLAQHIGFLARREGITFDKMVDRVRKNNAFGPLRQQLLRQSVLDFVLKEAKFE